MNKTYEAYSDFVDDCFVDEEPLCNLSRDKSLELFHSELILGMMQEEGEPKTCLVSLRDEPKVA